MSEKEEKRPSDPFAQMVQFYDDWTKTWAGAASQLASSKGFADSMAQQLESTLGMTQLMRRQMSEMMERSLQQMNVPTRKQVSTLAEQMTHIEMRLDDMEAKLDRVLDLLKRGRESGA